jgi:hypothetical protein
LVHRENNVMIPFHLVLTFLHGVPGAADHGHFLLVNLSLGNALHFRDMYAVDFILVVSLLIEAPSALPLYLDVFE